MARTNKVSANKLNMKRFSFLLLLVLLLIGSEADAQTYYVYAAAESEDEVAVIKFDGKSATVDETIVVGNLPTEIEGPHGLAIDPKGEFWYLTIAHGVPYGFLNKYRTDTNELVGSAKLGMFPATMQVSKSTGLVYAVNFNLHGDHIPSTVSVVDPRTMIELAQVETGIMPHGSRLSVDGRKHYSLAMMSDELYEIDAWSLQRTRTLNLANPDSLKPHMMMNMGKEKMGAEKEKEEVDHSKMDHAAMGHDMGAEKEKEEVDHSKMDHAAMGHDMEAEKEKEEMDHSKMDHAAMGHDMEAKSLEPSAKEEKTDHSKMDHSAMGHSMGGMAKPLKKPTWVTPHPSKDFLYVACNGAREVKEIDTKNWTVTRTFFTGKGPYNVEVSPDGAKMVVTYKSEGRTGIWDLESGKELAALDNTRQVPHGIAITPDSKYAFVTVEGIGGEPGTVDVFDLNNLTKVSAAEMGKQAGGIVFWKMVQ